MLKRLTLSREPTAAGHVLEGVPRLSALKAGRCGVARALMAALEHARRPAGYDPIMGLTGIAFLLPIEEDFGRTPGDATRCERMVEALAALGVQGEWRMVGDGGAVDMVKEVVDASFAVPLLGWPGEGDDWGIVTGYDPGRKIICGWPARYDGAAYLGAPPKGEAAIVIQGKSDSQDTTEAARECLRWASEQRESVARGYDLWRGMLDGRFEGNPDDPALAARIGRHEALVEALADARSAAAGFLAACGELLEGVSGEWALAAAEGYDRLVELLEARRPPVYDETVLEALASAAWRREWREQLGEIAELDTRALGEVRKVLSADIGPEEQEAVVGA